MASFDCGPTKRDFSPHETARIIQFNQSRGSAIQALLVPEPLPIPVPFQRNASSKRKEPKNFQKNHLTVLRDMQYQNKVKKELEGRKTKLKKLSMFKNVSSKVFNSEGFSKENGKDVDTIHSTKIYSDEISSIANSFGVEAENNSSASEMASSKNYILKNKIDAIRPRPRIPTKPKPKRHHDSYGKVPEYVIKRKLELAEIDRMRNDEDKSVQIPEGALFVYNFVCIPHHKT